MKIKEIPNEDRPYEHCLRSGPEDLSDAELLSIIIRSGSKEANSLDLASKILALNYPKEGILGLLHLSLEELMSVKGIGQVKGIQLLCIGELSRRIWKRKVLEEPLSLDEPQKIADYYQEDMRHRDREEFHAMFFNSRQSLIRETLISKGTVNASIAEPREILVEALRCQAVSMILVHNHPSGDPQPSREDLAVTERIRQAGNLVGISLVDHVIIGDNTYVSLKERGLI